MPFATLGLRAELLRALADAGYTTPTPVQAQAIPVILQGRDILAGAQTGTGKTAGFALPLLQRLMAIKEEGASPRPERIEARRNENGRSPSAFRPSPPAFRPVRALILTPTRELAAQVEESVRVYGKHLPLTSTVVFGGVNIQPQFQALRRGVDILVATPGRLLDHVQQRTVDLSRVEILVLDEADRMLDMGFIRDIRKILALLPPRRQNLLFSATFPDEIKALADSLLNAPTRVEVARQNTESDLVSQAVYLATPENKRSLLVHLLAEEKIQQALVFTRTKHGADRLAKQLQRDGISAVPIHGNRSQSQRTRALADFKAGIARILVATDLAARGLDIDQLPHVINFELPNVPEDYVHRIGRTGRAGSAGEAISLVSAEEQRFLADIERLIKKRIVRREAVGFVATASSFQPEETRAPRPYNTRSAPRPRSQAQSPRTPRASRPANAVANASRQQWQPSLPPARQGATRQAAPSTRSNVNARPTQTTAVSAPRPMPHNEKTPRKV